MLYCSNIYAIDWNDVYGDKRQIWDRTDTLQIDSNGNIGVNIQAGSNDIGNVVVIEGTDQELFDYDGRTDGQPVYAGFGATGLATSATGWTIHKYTYDASGFVTSEKTAIGIYDNRGSLTYE